jgi:tRNA1Val (adenine37-N6)-methyltransferase
MSIKTKGFQFKAFTIFDSESGMPVSTDGVLLGAWCAISQASTILDIGTGTGLLALMSAQRNSNALICAVDIDQRAIAAAAINFNKSAWSNRLQLIKSDIKEFALNQNIGFDSIICNPPYFNSGEQSQQEARATARHTDTLSHPDLLSACHQLLNTNGSASFILPTIEAEHFITLAKQSGWHLSRLCKVRTTLSKPVSRYLFELRKQPLADRFIEESTLFIHQGDSYSPQFIELTQSFYLKM